MQQVKERFLWKVKEFYEKRLDTPAASPHLVPRCGAAPFWGTACVLCSRCPLMSATARFRPLSGYIERLGVPVFRCFAEGSPVVHPGVRGTIVATEARNARIAAIVRIAESKKAAQAGAKEIHLMAIRPTIANLRIFRDAASQRAIFMES